MHSAAWGVVGRATAAEAGRGVVDRLQLRTELLQAEGEVVWLQEQLRRREVSLGDLASAARDSKIAARRGAALAAARVEAGVARLRLECEEAVEAALGQGREHGVMAQRTAAAEVRERGLLSAVLQGGEAEREVSEADAMVLQRAEADHRAREAEGAAREATLRCAAADTRAAAEAQGVEAERRAAAAQVAAESEHAEAMGGWQRQLAAVRAAHAEEMAAAAAQRQAEAKRHTAARVALEAEVAALGAALEEALEVGAEAEALGAALEAVEQPRASAQPSPPSGASRPPPSTTSSDASEDSPPPP